MPAKAEKAARPRGGNVAGDRARDQILDVAIRLFAREGYGGASIRDVTTEAGVNQAAVFYHFGAKRDLYLAAVSKFFDIIAEQRYAMLGDARRRGALQLEDVLRALIAPHIRFVTRKNGRDYLRLFATFSSTPRDILQELYAKHFGPLRHVFLAAIAEAEPGLDDEALHRAFAFITNMIVSSLFDASYEDISGHRPDKVDVEPFIDLLVAYNAAGVRALAAAPPAAPAKRAVRTRR